MYQRPLRPDELMHWGIKKGEEAKKHKYFQRELIGTNNGRNIYKYYYTKAEYDRAHNASIQQKSKQQNVFKKFISFTKSVSDTVVKNVNRMINQTVADTKANIYLGKKIVSNLLHKQKTSETKETIAQPGQSTNYTARKKKEERDKYFKDNDYFNVNRPDGYQRPVENPIGPKKYKYVARIPNPNGKGYYYFYSESAYKKWLDKNGGDEEKLVKEFGLKKNPATEEEDMAEVNEKNNRNTCWSCSLAYELRRRGYNTEAIDTNNGESQRILMRAFSETDTDLEYRVEQAECKSLLVKYGAGSGNVSEDEAKKIFADDAKRYDMAKNLKKGMEKNYPNGARGFFSIGWYQGGGHSVVWEIKDGELLIRENQNNVTYKGAEAIEYMSMAGGTFTYGKESQYVLSCVPFRTDNKTINPEYILTNPESAKEVNKNRTMVNKN